MAQCLIGIEAPALVFMALEGWPMSGKEVMPIESVIVSIRGHRVIPASDLARIYGVETRTLNQAVKRNQEKFPSDFMFQMTRIEAEKSIRSRSQTVILKRGQNVKYLPYVFTEYGAIMAANVLNSPHAINMSVFVVRAFVRLRHTIIMHKELASKLSELERKVVSHDGHIKSVFDALRQLMERPATKSSRIGFKT
jgi:ORF6N domain